MPPEYLGRGVWVRWDGRLVRIFNDTLEQIAVHVQQQAGRFSTKPQHIAGEKISGVERGAAWLLGRVRRSGPQATALGRGDDPGARRRGRSRAARTVEPGQSPSRRPHRTGLLTSRQSHGAYRLRTVRDPDRRQAPEQARFPSWRSIR